MVVKFHLILIAFLILIFGCSNIYAQHISTGLYLTGSIPLNEFGDTIESNIYGISGYFAYDFDFLPFILGAEFGYMMYGRETRKEPFSPYVPEVDVKVTTTNNFLRCHTFVRFQKKLGEFRPYYDTLIGFNYIYTMTSVCDDEFGNESIARNTHIGDVAPSLGAGAGFQLQIYSNDKPENIKGVLIDFRFVYLFGSEAEYLKKGSIKF